MTNLEESGFGFHPSRRAFLKWGGMACGAALGGLPFTPWGTLPAHAADTALPVGSAPEPVVFPYFPDRLHAFIWRNWMLVPTKRVAKVIGAEPDKVLELGRSMGLGAPPTITEEQQRRSYITVIRRNWHLLPYDQLLTLLDWDAEELAYTLREDDFLFIKLGSLKPDCEPLKYAEPDDATGKRAREIAKWTAEAFPQGPVQAEEPLFQFVEDLSKPPASQPEPVESTFDPRFCYSYFALYDVPLADEHTGPYPDGLLAKLVEAGANSVWLNAVLYKLTPFPWEPSLSEGHEQRLEGLAKLVRRAADMGVGVFLYLNEPRVMPLPFFDEHPELKGVERGDIAHMCTSAEPVQEYLVSAVARICEAIPELRGFFTITASENPTNCWSHGQGDKCPRCSQRSPAEVIAEVNGLVVEGIKRAGSKAELIAWDWGWADAWAPEAIKLLPKDVAHMSVSEWSIPIERGGVDSVVGEYSISEVGPGPRATRHWKVAREQGLKTVAKIQAGTTWELGSVPYIPALENVAQHAANLREAGVGGLMLGWSLGGYPSPNLEVVAEIGKPAEEGEAPVTTEAAMRTVAARRFGEELAPAVVEAWKAFSAAFSEFPYHISVVYNGPHHMGPANPLWGSSTGYNATMVGLPYDDLDRWRAVYPPDVFAAQYEKIADGFDAAIVALKEKAGDAVQSNKTLRDELSVSQAVAIHYRSSANQVRFVMARDALLGAEGPQEAKPLLAALERLLHAELDLAKRLHAIQTRDSRIGFEASNHYFYVPMDLAEKVVNSRYLLEHWLPQLRQEYKA